MIEECLQNSWDQDFSFAACSRRDGLAEVFSSSSCPQSTENNSVDLNIVTDFEFELGGTVDQSIYQIYLQHDKATEIRNENLNSHDILDEEQVRLSALGFSVVR